MEEVDGLGSVFQRLLGLIPVRCRWVACLLFQMDCQDCRHYLLVSVRYRLLGLHYLLFHLFQLRWIHQTLRCLHLLAAQRPLPHHRQRTRNRPRRRGKRERRERTRRIERKRSIILGAIATVSVAQRMVRHQNLPRRQHWRLHHQLQHHHHHHHLQQQQEEEVHLPHHHHHRVWEEVHLRLLPLLVCEEALRPHQI